MEEIKNNCRMWVDVNNCSVLSPERAKEEILKWHKNELNSMLEMLEEIIDSNSFELLDEYAQSLGRRYVFVDTIKAKIREMRGGK